MEEYAHGRVSAILYKWNNFHDVLFVFMYMKTLLKKESFIKDLSGSKFFPFINNL